MSPTIAQAGEPPVGGAPAIQIMIAAAVSLLLCLPVARVVLRERAGKPTLIGTLADYAGWITGMPRWLALPMALQLGSLATAGFGVFWDLPWHTDLGRDEGPLANPAHYFILAGLLGVFAAGVLSAAFAIGGQYRFPGTKIWGAEVPVPSGSVVMTLAGLIGLSGFPLDDVWHRLFGQDVTEWGPTHVLMIGGAVTSLLGTMLLIAEARRATGGTSAPLRQSQVLVAGAWLLGISVFLMEYEVGVPQYPMIAQVVLLALAPTWALVYARVSFGPGGAALAVAMYLIVRVVFLVITGPVLGRTAAQFSLFVAQAVIVELLPLVIPTSRPVRFAAVAGALIGSVGIVAEAAWTHVFLPLPWPVELWPRFTGYGVLAGIGAGLVVGWQLGQLHAVSQRRPIPGRHGLGLVGAAAVVLAMVLAVPRADDQRLAGELTLQGAGTAMVTVRLTEPAAAEGAVWFHALSWQGGGRVLVPMERIDGGSYRTSRPVPVHDSWKTVIRLHLADDYLVSLPVYLPADTAIPAEEIPATDGVRPFQPEQHILQREAKRGLPGWLWGIGYGSVFAIYALAMSAMALCYARAARADHGATIATRRATRTKIR